MKEPSREPDYVSQAYRYYFDEMISFSVDNKRSPWKLVDSDGELISENNTSFITVIQKAYTDWKINNILLGDKDE